MLQEIPLPILLLFFVLSIAGFVVVQLWISRRLVRISATVSRRLLLSTLALLLVLVGVNQLVSFTDPLAEDLSNNVFVYVASTLEYYQCDLPQLRRQLSRLAPEEVVRDYVRPFTAAGQQNFIDDAFPLVKADSHQRCALGLGPAANCLRDADGDGFALQTDCNDQSTAVYPGATDQPFNALDENCNGVDDGRPNVILLVLESFGTQAVQSVSGGDEAVTPVLNGLARSGAVFKNFYSGGTTTAYSLISALCSIQPSAQRPLNGASGPEMLCLPEILRGYGYRTLELQAGDLGFLDKYAFFERVGFDTAKGEREFSSGSVDGWGITDVQLFSHISQQLDEIDQPFFLTAYNVSGHHPWHYPTDGVPPLYPDTTLQNRLFNLMHYTDSALGQFLEENKDKPWMQNTIVLVTADNGQPLGNKEVFNYVSFLNIYEENVWVPLIVVGSPQLRGEQTQIGSHIDIPPTILNLLGINIPNPFRGRSLLQPIADIPAAFLTSQLGGCPVGVVQNDYKYITDLRHRYHELYQLSSDRTERSNLYSGRQEQTLPLDELLFRWYLGNIYLHQGERIWSTDYQRALDALIAQQRYATPDRYPGL